MVDDFMMIDIRKVFEVLKSAKYEHNAEKGFEACFKNWDKPLDSDERLLAGLIRIALFDAVSSIMKKMSNGEFDMKDVLIILVSAALGLDKLSLLVEVAENGLEKLYKDENFEVFNLCMSKIFETLSQKIDNVTDEYEVKEVMLQ
jgi:hypothetical protein